MASISDLSLHYGHLVNKRTADEVISVMNEIITKSKLEEKNKKRMIFKISKLRNVIIVDK